MIGSLNGTLKVKTPTEVLVDVNGVGYAVTIPFSTFEKLGALNSTVFLYTHLVVREDVLQLYGFATEDERFLFKLLISVSGIGPKIAQGILSGISSEELRRHIASGNASALTAVPNVGKKTAERLVLELREKISKVEFTSRITPDTDVAAGLRSEALLALTSLGYSRQSAEQAIRRVLQESNGQSLALEEVIKRALRHASSK